MNLFFKCFDWLLDCADQRTEGSKLTTEVQLESRAYRNYAILRYKNDYF